MASTIIWTTLPNGFASNGANARFSVFVSLRLDARAAGTLAEHPEFSDWPATLLAAIGATGLSLELDDGSGATTSLPVSFPGLQEVLDSAAWQAIFPAQMAVRATEPPEDHGMRMQSYPAGRLASNVRALYGQQLASDLDVSISPPSMKGFDVPARVLRAPVVNDVSAAEEFMAFYSPQSASQSSSGLAQRAKAPAEIDCPDFHEVVGSLGSHPQLLRILGLVIDCEVAAEALVAAGENLRIRVQPALSTLAPVNHYSPWTAATTAGRRFAAAATPGRRAGSLIVNGEIVQEQLEHAATALVQQARTNADEALPALLQGGMRLMHSEFPSSLFAAMREQVRLEAGMQRALTPGLLAAGDEEPLYAEQLSRGFRVDVRRVEDGETAWRSLCEREVRYAALGWSYPPAGEAVRDEGVVEPVAYKDHQAEFSEVRITEELFEWDGWSLVVPRDASPSPAACAEDAGTPLQISTQVAAASLEPQRFGRCYQFRLREVDLAGNSLSVVEANTDSQASSAATDPVCCLRVESAKPPVVMRGQPRGPGEAGDVVVIRDADDRRFRADEVMLHVLPPEVPLRIAEKHGVFDGMNAADSWQLIQAHRGKLEIDADGNERDFVADKEIYAPYLPDPMVKQAVLILPDGSTVDLPRFDDIPWVLRDRKLARSCQIVIRRGNDVVSARVAGRRVIVEIPRGRTTKLKLAARLDGEQLAVAALANPEWNREWTGTNDAARSRLIAAAATGGAPLLAPSREITCVYATQRPLAAPEFSQPLILPREKGASSATLADDRFVFDSASSGRVDLYARWVDRIDSDAGWVDREQHLQAGTVRVTGDADRPFAPPGFANADSPARSPLSHDFGDTRHREVFYRAVAASRFAEFYPDSVTTEPDGVELTSAEVRLSLPSTAPPARPGIVYGVPTLSREESGTWGRDSVRSEQRGQALRIYLERGWFSSGNGEQLAVVLENSKTAGLAVSEWGANALHEGAPLPGALRAPHIWSGANRIRDWRIGDTSVDLVTHDVQFSETQRLPFVDIEFLSQRAFMPLVRLALARYQANSIDGCHLSDIVQADFLPLSPDRTIAVHRLANDRWRIAVAGYGSGTSPERASIVEAQLEVAPADIEDDVANWRPAGESFALDPSVDRTALCHWSGDIVLRNAEYLSRLWRRRLVVREFESLASAGVNQRARLVAAFALQV